MCGFAGRVASDKPTLEVNDLRAVLGHRGPDGAGVAEVDLFGKRAVLGHVRLSILDASDTGAQPMSSPDGRWLVVYNGEIYNHSELRAELAASFRGHCDTETLVKALEVWGIDETVRRMNGLFAFAALDQVKGKLFLVRDQCGIKPVYYRHDTGGLTFASEVRPLALMTRENLVPDPDGLRLFLSFRYTPSPHTVWSGVSRLAPGHLVEFDIASNTLSTRRYLRSERAPFEGTEAEALAGYCDVISQAVRRQLISDVPVGILLSGGIDSAMVAALAAEAGHKLRAFTVGFGSDHPECEIEAAKHTADVLGLEHRSVRIDADSAWQSLLYALSHNEEPLGTTSLVAMWPLSALAGEDVKVVLTGQGTDELFGGYRRYQGELLARYLPRGPGWNMLGALMPLLGRRGEVLARAFNGLGPVDEAAHMARVHALFTDSECQALGYHQKETLRLDPLNYWLGWADEGGLRDPVARMMAIDLRMSLADDLLLYGDRISMAHSIEARVPMLDNAVVDFVESLPRAMRVRWRDPKRLHRMAARRLLPRSIVDRPKLGFQVPVDSWARGPWRERIEAELFERGALGRLVDIEAVHRIWEQHKDGRRDRTRQVFALLALSVWAGEWVEAG